MDTPGPPWLSADPLGFVDGVNLFTYVRNEPNLHHDPLGYFGWKEVYRKEKECGDFEWKVRFLKDRNPQQRAKEKNGWLVQKVTAKWRIYMCGEHDDPSEPLIANNFRHSTKCPSTQQGPFEEYVYFEQWKVVNGKISSIRGLDKYDQPLPTTDTDTFFGYNEYGNTEHSSTYVTGAHQFEMKGEVAFVPKEAAGLLAGVWGFGDGGLFTHGMWSTCAEQPNWPFTGVQLTRGVNFDWECCCDREFPQKHVDFYSDPEIG